MSHHGRSVLSFLWMSFAIGFSLRVDDLLTDSKCGVSTKVPGGVVVSHQPIDSVPPFSNDITCFFTMQTPKFRQKIRFELSHFSLTPTDCSLSYLKIFDGKDDTEPLISTICPGDNVVGIEHLSSSYWMTLKLQVTSSTPKANFSGFYVSFTDDRDPCADTTLEMMCRNGRCVYQELQCDGIDSCGDGTDEDTAAPSFCNGTSPTPSTGASSTGASSTGAPSTGSITITNTTLTPDPLTRNGSVSSTTKATQPIGEGQLSDLTPLYIILTITVALFSAYLVYALLSIPCFKSFMLSCLNRCCLMMIRRRRKVDEKRKERNGRKVTPEKLNGSMEIINLSSSDLKSNGVNPATPNKDVVNGKNGFSKTLIYENGFVR